MINYKDSSVPGKEKDSTSPFCNKQDGLTMTNIIDESGRKKLVEILDNYKTDTKWKDNPAQTVKTSEVKLVEWAILKSFLTPIMDGVLLSNAHYFGYHLYPTSGRECLNYNIYRTGTEYKYHSDSSAYASTDMKLTCLLNISTEPYEGGDFHLKYGDEDKPINFPVGSLFVFKPYIFHRVKPITKGIRRTLTLWMYGPRWQ